MRDAVTAQHRKTCTWPPSSGFACRSSGLGRRNPVNLLTFEGTRYPFAAHELARIDLRSDGGYEPICSCPFR